MKTEEHEYVILAREAIEKFALFQQVIKPKEPLPEVFNRRAGVFVSIKKEGVLRGCIGTIAATTANIAQEIINNALSAANSDPRFPAIKGEELNKLAISVDVLGETEEIESLEELDPLKYGVVVEKGWQRGLLLPNLAGIDTPEEQVEIARKKAGIEPTQKVKLYRFQVDRYE